MIFGNTARAASLAVKVLLAATLLAIVPQTVLAQAPVAAAPVAAASAPAIAAPVAPAPVASAVAASPAAPSAVGPVIVPGYKAGHFDVAPGGYSPMKPTPGKGMPIPGGFGFQKQYSPIGEYGLWFHDTILIWLCVLISAFVLGLLLYVVIRFNAKRNPVPDKISHNTFIEIVWTALPVLILAGVALPSIDLLAKQFKPAPAHSLTIKATGNQWFWSYTYPDNGGIEVVSNMLPEEEAIKHGEPSHLAADYRMVVPAGEPIRMQITGADVIHSFSVPSLWFKLDGVPGRINEKVLFIKEPGVYYGQCSELCGARHGYMPIAVEALPRAQFNAWVKSQQGGVIDGTPKAPAAAAPSAPAAAPAAAAPAVPAPVA